MSRKYSVRSAAALPVHKAISVESANLRWEELKTSLFGLRFYCMSESNLEGFLFCLRTVVQGNYSYGDGGYGPGHSVQHW